MVGNLENKVLLVGAAVLTTGAVTLGSIDRAYAEDASTSGEVTCPSTFSAQTFVDVQGMEVPAKASDLQEDSLEVCQVRFLNTFPTYWGNQKNRPAMHTAASIDILAQELGQDSTSVARKMGIVKILALFADYEVSQHGAGKVPASTSTLNNPKVRSAMLKTVQDEDVPVYIRNSTLHALCKTSMSESEVSEAMVNLSLHTESDTLRTTLKGYLTLDSVGETLLTKMASPGANKAAGDEIQVGAMRTFADLYQAKVQSVAKLAEPAKATAMQQYAPLTVKLNSTLTGILFTKTEPAPVREQAAKTLLAVFPEDDNVKGIVSATGHEKLLGPYQ